MGKIRILHISDIHLTDQGESIWGVNTLEHFHKFVEGIKTHPYIDAIIISGDMSNDGSRWSYKYADRIFSQLGIPTYVCMGNHDNLDALYGSTHFCRTTCVFNVDDLEIINLNSVIPDEPNYQQNKSRGRISREQLNFIRRASAKYEKLAIVLHHPPFETGGWLDRRILENRKEFVQCIESCGNVRLVMYGHIHCYTKFIKNGIVYTSAPAISYAYNNRLAKFQIDNGAEGYNLIEINDEEIFITPYLLNDVKEK